MKTRILVLASVIVILGANMGWSQLKNAIRVNVPFEFTVGNKTLPAGQYDFAREALNNALQVSSVKNGPSADAIVLARLWGGIHSTPADSHIVFDQVGNKYILSELWIPGADGFLFNIGKDKHERRVIDVKY